MTGLVSPTFVLSVTGQDFVLRCHSPAAMGKTQHSSHEVEQLFDNLTQTVPHSTEIWVGLWTSRGRRWKHPRWPNFLPQVTFIPRNRKQLKYTHCVLSSYEFSNKVCNPARSFSKWFSSPSLSIQNSNCNKEKWDVFQGITYAVIIRLAWISIYVLFPCSRRFPVHDSQAHLFLVNIPLFFCNFQMANFMFSPNPLNNRPCSVNMLVPYCET